MRQLKVLVFFNFTGILILLQWKFIKALVADGLDKCIEYEKLGCYKDSLKEQRPLPKLIENYRGTFNWTYAQESINSKVLLCARAASQKGFIVFGLQFYGECWSGENTTQTYFRDGPSNKCFMAANNTEFKECDDNSDEACVGVAYTNYVYRITHPVDGNFSAWSDWSQCSASCGGGQKTRTRACNNPPPSKCGKTCLGDKQEAVSCNTQSCPAPEPCEDKHPDCKQYKDIGLCSPKYPVVLKTCKKSCGRCP